VDARICLPYIASVKLLILLAGYHLVSWIIHIVRLNYLCQQSHRHITIIRGIPECVSASCRLEEVPDLRGTLKVPESNITIISYGLKRRAKRLTERDHLSGNRCVFNIEGILVSCGLAMINVITVALNHIVIN
jgi:hypothetical protein